MWGLSRNGGGDGGGGVTNMWYKIVAELKSEVSGSVTVLIVLIVIIAVSVIHENNKNFAWYFYLSYNVSKHVL